MYFRCCGYHCYCRYRFGKCFFSLRSSTGSSPCASVGGWCNDFCLPVLGPTRGFCRHQIRAFHGLTWLKSLCNGRNHFVVASHHLSWHRSRLRPSPTALSFLTNGIPGPCGGGIRLGSRADHRGPLPKSRTYLCKTAIGVLGGLLQPRPNFAGFGGVGVSFLFGGVLLRFALGGSGIDCGRFLWANYYLFWQGRYYPWW